MSKPIVKDPFADMQIATKHAHLNPGAKPVNPFESMAIAPRKVHL